jgi:hypothetical protein
MNTVIKVGDLIKSKDFPGNEECYMVGIVTNVETNGSVLDAKTIKIVFGGEVKEIVEGMNDTFTTVAPGKSFTDGIFGDKFNRIEVLA